MQKIGATTIIIVYILVLIAGAYNCYISFSYPIKYYEQIEKVCAEFNIPKPMFCALINTESSFNPNAKSSAGAIGLTQILPTTAQYICVKNNIDYSNFDLYNPHDNLYLGSMYLRYLFDQFDNRYTALSAYNAGETTVRAWLKNPEYSYDQISLYNIPYKETDNYIKKIKKAEVVYIDFYNL